MTDQNINIIIEESRLPGTTPLPPANETEVSDTARNGLITAIGLILGFALNFASQWGLGPDPWKLETRVVYIILLIGIFILVTALFRALIPYKLSQARYESAAKFLLFGVLVQFIGFLWVLKGS